MKQTPEWIEKRIAPLRIKFKGRKCPWISDSNRRRIGYTYSRRVFKCLICDKEVNEKASLNHIFCSRDCYYKSRIGKKYIMTEKHRNKLKEVAHKRKGSKNPKLSELNKLKTLDKNPNWNGGKSFEIYGIEFNNSLRMKIRKRDKFTCFICRKNGYSIHHIDYNKWNNNEKNLITLCKSCHAKTNFNRINWISFFKTEVVNG